MTKQQITKYLKMLNDQLAEMGIKGEICLYGGAAMCLAFNARQATKDVDAVFEPAQKVRLAALRLAKIHDLKEDWLNDAVKGFVVRHNQKVLFNWPNLKVFHAEAEYLLAMKAMSARQDTTDRKDIIFLVEYLKIQSPEEVFAAIEKYYHKRHIKAATQFFIEELFS
jgi:hypothetical protein